MRGQRLTARQRTAILALLAAIACDCALAQTPAASSTPRNNWAAQITAIDASGRSAQHQLPYSNYDQDVYEDLDYNAPGARRADIDSVAGGIDAGFLYFSLGTLQGWVGASQSVSVAIELETGRSSRGDYFVKLNMLGEFDDKEKWKDAGTVATYDLRSDANNDVGGANPDAVDSSPGDGYETRIPVASGIVFARVMGNGTFEIAVSRAALGVSAANYFRFRAWTEQAGNTLDPGTFTFHDHLPIMNIGNVDSSAGADTDTWPIVSDVEADAIDIAITQAVDLPDSREGDTLRFTTTVSHIDGTSTAEDVQVEFILPAGLSLVSVDAGGGQWDARKNKWTLPSLAPGAQAAFVTTAVIDAGQKGRQIDTVATLTQVRQDDYNGVNNVGGSSVRVVGYDGSIEFTDANGAPPGAVFPGQDLFVRVSDPDLDGDGLAIETIVASIASETTRDVAALTLTETAPDSGVFEGSGPTEVRASAIAGDALLQVTGNDRVTATYIDLIDSQFNQSVNRTDTLSYEQSAPLITLVNYADKPAAKPGDTITYRIDYVNTGAGAATSLVVQDFVPDHTAYVAGSMRAGAYASAYASALALTDADDGAEGSINGASVAGHFDGQKIVVSIASVEASDGTTGTGSDSGTVYFQVRVE